ncbi:hypothetical protein [Micrococcus sp. FDAARGOS_333]|uniref:hypothetical protein n=1 Tax=Micrococcus sp. FDAARGOS_333 TaxID=1930558 RepID=UPI000B4E242B|nr:hypothetical protein [Micrococcus sp. FDAARGOS_333]PNL16779.1 hypothetical protein CEQ11_000110 [Micrococcus sp. FDAARGOS_333]PNL18796.1 hypothetical protein CEQ11_012570 [Micrococcus sp. FDAARGOS_333]
MSSNDRRRRRAHGRRNIGSETAYSAGRRRADMKKYGVLRHWADLYVFTGRGALIGALLCALLLGVVGWVGWTANTAEPKHTAEITVQGEDTVSGISQESVDQVIGDRPIPSWRPLQVLVTDDYFASLSAEPETDEYDVVISTRPDDRPHHLGYEREYAGIRVAADVRAAMNHEDKRRYRVELRLEGRYHADLARGMGPTAVVNTVRDIGDRTYDGQPRGVFTYFAWGLPALIGLLVCGAAGLRLSTRERGVRRGMKRAQASLARTMLEDEALALADVSVAGSEERRRIKDGRRALHKSLEAVARRARTTQRRMDRLGEPLGTPRFTAEGRVQDNRDHLHTRSWRELAVEVEELVADTERLSGRTEALIDSSDVLVGTARSTRVLDRVLGPTATALIRLKARLRDAPSGTVAEATLETLDDAHEALLALAQDEEFDQAGTRRWTSAEDRLTTVLRDVSDQLGRYPIPMTPRADGPDEDDTARQDLRRSLGLPSDAGLRDALADADHAARTLLGAQPEGLDVQPDPEDEARRHERASAAVGREALVPKRFLAGTRAIASIGLGPRGWAFVLMLVCLPAFTLAGELRDRLTEDSAGAAVQEQQLGEVAAVRLDGPAYGVQSERLPQMVNERMPGEYEVVVAVRRAEDYLAPLPVPDDAAADGRLDPAVTQEGVHRILRETGAAAPETGEPAPGVMVVPVYVWEDGTRQVGSALVTMDGPRMDNGTASFQRVEIVEDHDEITRMVATEVRLAADELRNVSERAHTRFGDVSSTTTHVLLTASILGGLVALLMVLDALTGQAAGVRGLGSLGRGARRLRGVMRRLETLMLGLDRSRIDAVAVLGAGPAGTPAEAGQRLYERELVAAWREAQVLAETSLVERARAGDFGARVARLERTVAVLEARDEDVSERVEDVLERSLRHAPV